MSMMELGVGHFRSPNMTRQIRAPAPVRQLPAAEPSVFEMTPEMIRQKRDRDVCELLLRGRGLRKAANKVSAIISDHDLRVDPQGRCRCLTGVADDAATAARDDAESDEDAESVFHHSCLSDFVTSGSALDDFQASIPEAANSAIVGPGIVYSTTWYVHQQLTHRDQR